MNLIALLKGELEIEQTNIPNVFTVLNNTFKLKSAVKEKHTLHFDENQFLVNMKILLIGLYFGKILGDLTPPK